MKLLALVFLLNVVVVGQTNDFCRYERAYQFINNDSSIKVFFKNYYSFDSLCIHVLDQVVYLGDNAFLEDIINYEYKNLDSVSKKSIRDSLLVLDSTFQPYRVPYLNDLNSDTPNVKCKLLLFFSKINDSKLHAEVLMTYDGYPDYYFIYDRSPIFLRYLFYFEKNFIVKVFVKEFAQ